MRVVKLLPRGLDRVMDGIVGMTFIVDRFTDTVDHRGQMAHVRDYRYSNLAPFCIWSLGPEDYEEVKS